MKKTFAITLFVSFWLLACSKEVPSDPMCRVQNSQPKSPPAAAACLIKLNRKLLVLKNHESETWSLPVHKMQKDVSAQCTAHRAVWKTTGLNVEIGKLLLIDKRNVHYFSCQTNNPFSESLTSMPVPPWSQQKVSHINLIDPFETVDNEWNEKIDLIKLRKAFTQTN